MQEDVLGNGGKAAGIFYVGIRWEWLALPRFSGGKISSTRLDIGCVFLTADMGSVAGREISVSAGIEPRFLYRVASNTEVLISP